jgi:hypothetical protein
MVGTVVLYRFRFPSAFCVEDQFQIWIRRRQRHKLCNRRSIVFSVLRVMFVHRSTGLCIAVYASGLQS